MVLGLRPGRLMGARRRLPLRALLAVAVGTAAVGFAGFTAGPDEVEPVCERPEDLQTRRGIKLTADAMEAFRHAEALAGQSIEVVHSYRSCWKQARACRAICGRREGCPGTCARPGLSWHQRGEAVDITEAMLATPGVVEAMNEAGWCQSVPVNDPGHFSFDGCH